MQENIVDSKNERWETKLMLACREWNLGQVESLIKQRVNPNIQDNDWNVALIYILEYSDPSAFPILESPDSIHQLLTRPKRKDLAIVKFLLKSWASPMIKNKVWRSAYDWARDCNAIDIVDLYDLWLLSDLIFPDAKPISHWFEKYPVRPEGQFTTRLAPSPTGFMHTWAIYMSVINHKLAKQSGWNFLLRIEDTDQKRFVEWATDLIVSGLNEFGLEITEWPLQGGGYGPYFQSERKEIYHSFAKHLLSEGKAYPCWMTAEELTKIRDEQMKTKKVPWIYGNYSKWRNASVEEYMEQYQADSENCVIRFRSHGEVRQKVLFEDINRWKINMTDNYNDSVLIKKWRGLPTYHLAHIVDDSLMRMTHILRWEEWLTSVPFHLQLFAAFDLPVPTYCHLPSILKTEDGKKRKLSKRKDPEAGVQYLFEQGFPAAAIIDYLIALVDSSYEDRYNENIEGELVNSKEITDSYHDGFVIDLEKISSSWSLFDLQKLTWWSNKYLSKLTNKDLYDQVLSWAKRYKKESTVSLLIRDEALAKAALSMERHSEQDPKRFSTFMDIEAQVDFFYDEIWQERLSVLPKEEYPECMTQEVINKFVAIYIENLDFNLSKEEWFAQLKEIGARLWFAMNNKEFKEGGFIGKVGELAMFLRMQICGAKRTPDLCNVMQVLGNDRVVARLGAAVR